MTLWDLGVYSAALIFLGGLIALAAMGVTHLGGYHLPGPLLCSLGLCG